MENQRRVSDKKFWISAISTMIENGERVQTGCRLQTFSNHPFPSVLCLLLKLKPLVFPRRFSPGNHASVVVFRNIGKQWQEIASGGIDCSTTLQFVFIYKCTRFCGEAKKEERGLQRIVWIKRHRWRLAGMSNGMDLWCRLVRKWTFLFNRRWVGSKAVESESTDFFLKH